MLWQALVAKELAASESAHATARFEAATAEKSVEPLKRKLADTSARLTEAQAKLSEATYELSVKQSATSQASQQRLEPAVCQRRNRQIFGSSRAPTDRRLRRRRRR